MAEYRRFLSYVYSYPNGKKEQNTGFVKIEARGRDCRMQFGLQKLPQEETALDVYGFVRQGGILQGIFLGRIPAERGSAEGVIAAERQQMGGSSIRLEELSGLWLKGEGPADYITVWDDFGVETQKLVLEPEAASEESQETSEQPAVDAEPEIVSEENEVSAEPESALEKSEESAELESALEESEESAELESVSTEKQISAEPESALEESEVSAEPESVSTEKQISAEPESSFEESEILEKLKIDEKDDQKESGGQKKKSGMAAQETVCALPASLCPQIRYCPCGLDYRWECLSRNYAHRRPFALPDIQDCIEISPRDLTALRQPYWCLGRNRFLLRAYGSYQHLLLIQKKDGIVLLGIPGRYDPREARTASAYGFGVFLKAASENARTRFGYWCREVL